MPPERVQESVEKRYMRDGEVKKSVFSTETRDMNSKTDLKEIQERWSVKECV